MKKILIFALCYFTVSISHAWACSTAGPRSGTYEVRDGVIQYKPYREDNFTRVEGGDISTFLSNDEYRYKKISVTTTSGDEEYYYSDGQNTIKKEDRYVYFDLIKGWYGTNYASDANHVYYKGKRLDGINPVKTIFLEDGHREGSTIEGLEKLEWAQDGYVKDDARVYYRGELLEGANGSQFDRMARYQRSRVKDYYAQDDQHIYFYGLKVAGDPKTAFELQNGYYLDAKHIYFRGDVLEGALP